MATIFERCDKTIHALAQSLLEKFPSHGPLWIGKVKIDLVFARAERDDNGNLKGCALKKNGLRAYGIARKLPLKDRVMGRGDAEIVLDGDWWETATPEQQAALLDHELHHISLKADKHGNIQFDDIGRPQILLRKHDVEVGWFAAIAERHGAASIERTQAKTIMDGYGQFLWPELAPAKGQRALPAGTSAKASAKSV